MRGGGENSVVETSPEHARGYRVKEANPLVQGVESFVTFDSLQRQLRKYRFGN